MPQSFPVGQAPWETGQKQSFPVGKAPWEVASMGQNPPSAGLFGAGGGGGSTLPQGMENNAFSPQGLRNAAPLKNIALGLGSAAKSTTDALTGNSGTPLDLVNPIGWASKLFGAGVKYVGGQISKATDQAAPVFSAFGAGLRKIVGGSNVDRIVKSDFVQNNKNAINKLASDPDVQSGIGAVGNAANLMGTEAALGEGIGRGFNVAGEAMADTFKKSAIDSAKNDWVKPTTISKATYSTPTEVYNNAAENGHDIADTLVKNKIKLSDNTEGGNYATKDTAEKIRTDAGKASNEMLRPALQQADENPNTPKTPVADIVKKTISDIKNTKGITAADAESQIAQAEKQGAALSRKYPNGLSLTDMHDEKINYSMNGKYSPIGDVNVNNTASVNRSFGRTLAASVEATAPPEIPVHEFNAELQKQFQAADYLDSLDTKKVPVSIASRITKTAAKVTGAAVGDTLGGGILGGVGGYHIGGMVETLLEQMPNPIKESFLNNIKITNPPAFEALSKYIKAGPTPLFALPAPSAGSPQASVQAPIRMGGATEMEGQAPKGNYQSTQPIAWPFSPNPEITPEIKTQIQNDVVQTGTRFRSKLGFLNAVKSNPAFAEKISSAGWTPEMAWQNILKKFQSMGATNPLAKGVKSFPIPDPTLFGKK